MIASFVKKHFNNNDIGWRNQKNGNFHTNEDNIKLKRTKESERIFVANMITIINHKGHGNAV